MRPNRALARSSPSVRSARVIASNRLQSPDHQTMISTPSEPAFDARQTTLHIGLIVDPFFRGLMPDCRTVGIERRGLG